MLKLYTTKREYQEHYYLSLLYTCGAAVLFTCISLPIQSHLHPYKNAIYFLYIIRKHILSAFIYQHSTHSYIFIYRKKPIVFSRTSLLFYTHKKSLTARNARSIVKRNKKKLFSILLCLNLKHTSHL